MTKGFYNNIVCIHFYIGEDSPPGRYELWFICTMYYITSDIADCIPWFICTMYYITSDIVDCIPWFICTMNYMTSDIADCIPWFICTMYYITSDIVDCILTWIRDTVSNIWSDVILCTYKSWDSQQYLKWCNTLYI
jgi:hypothetical protein